ncbi:MAG: hypothetical protein F6K24_06145 [Okeania sp. SIO2D1]|nr:hypothetical protein [Okeania sp. SIO2D1]
MESSNKESISSSWYEEMEKELLGEVAKEDEKQLARTSDYWYEQNVIELLDDDPTLPLPPPKDPPGC